MSILRLSTPSLILAVAVFALGYGNPSFAKGKECVDGDSRPKCQTDPPAAGLTFKVEMDGAFVMDQLTTSNGNELNGVEEFTISRPGFDPGSLPGSGIACSAINDDDELQKACETWSHVFDVCDIYDIEGSDPYGPDEFTTTPNRKGKVEWVVYRYGGGIRVFFITSIASPIDTLNPLEVTLQLNSNCYYHEDHKDDFPGLPERKLCPDSFLPEVTDPPTTFDMMRFSNHARGEKGVAHAQVCHQKQGELWPSHSTLTITACPAGTEDPEDCPPSE